MIRKKVNCYINIDKVAPCINFCIIKNVNVRKKVFMSLTIFEAIKELETTNFSGKCNFHKCR